MESFPNYQVDHDPGQSQVAEELPLDSANVVDSGRDAQDGVTEKRWRKETYI